MQKSIFKKYFSICISLILVSITVLGVALMLFSFQYVKTEKYATLETTVTKAATAIELSVEDDDSMSTTSMQTYLAILADAIDSQVFVTDLTGTVIWCTEQSPCDHTDATLDQQTLVIMNRDGVYREMGSLDGIYETHYYTVGVTLTDTDGQVMGYVFCSMESTYPLVTFMQDILRMFMISSIGVLLMAVIIIYFVTAQMVRPLKEMSDAAVEFGNGDFTKRLTVESYDEIGQLAMALNNMAQSLSTLETMRRSFVSNVSHELKTPMTTIAGFIDGILDGTIPPNKQKYYLRIVSDEVKRLSRLVRSMLNLAQVEAGELQLKPVRFDMLDTVCQTLFSLEQQINQKNLEIRGLDCDKVWVEADEDLIHQVVYNLTENAIKFANEGGYIEFSFHKEGGRSIVGVKNSGEGLTKEEIPRVFDRFYKTDRSRGVDKNGVGLGLYIVRSIINLHGGDIIVRSVHGEYCEFLFSLNVAKPQSKILTQKLRGVEDAISKNNK